MNAPVQIRHPETAEELRTFAQREGKTITTFVQDLLHLYKRSQDSDLQQRIQAIRAIQDRVAALPRLEPWPTNDDFYDEDGMPR